ncbi:MAG: MFS transporter [Candidatus Nanopelagicales bacterium]
MSSRSWLPFEALEAATVFSGTANGISMIAFPWLVLEATGSASAAGALGAITAAPLLVSFLFAGVIVDIVGRRRVAVVSDLLSMTSVALVPILSGWFSLSFWPLAALAVLGATFDPAGISAREAMLPEAARSAGLRLERANGIHEAIWGAAFLIGPGIGGLAIGFLGAATTFWLSAAMFAVGALIMYAVRIPGAGRPQRHEDASGVWASTVEGVRFVWNDRILRTVGLVSMVIVGFWLPIEGVVLPVYFQGLDQPQRLGVTVMALSGGGIVGALIYGAIGHRIGRRLAFVTSMTGSGVAVLGMATLPAYAVLVIFAVLAGLFYGPVGPLVNLMIQHRTPGVLRGRVIGLLTSAAYVAGPIGYLISGPMVEFLGLQVAFVIMAVGVLVVALSTWFLPSLRHMDDTVGLPGE